MSETRRPNNDSTPAPPSALPSSPTPLHTVGHMPTVDPEPPAPPASLGELATVDPNGTRTIPPAPVALSSEPSAVVPGYAIERELGRGGMGVVYQARHLALKRTVALKMLLAGGHASPKQLARFRAEAEAVARLQHPNFVQIFEVGEVGGLPFFALEFIEGGSLAGAIAGNPQEPAAAARMVETLARALQYAHEAGIVHRDLKPANVLLATTSGLDAGKGDLGTPKVTDFGLAKPTEEGADDLDKSGQVLGTPSYMAPEQAMGDTHNIGPLADVYALGAMLYELLTGRPPFRGSNVAATLAQVMADDPLPPRRVVPGVPRDLETIALKCLQKDRARRYESATALADDLRRYLDNRPIEARPAGIVERSVKWVRRNPVATTALSLLALALGLAGVIGAFQIRELNREIAVARKQQEQRTALDDLLRDGRDAINDKRGSRPVDAVQHFEMALDRINNEPSLADFRDETQAELDRAKAEVEKLKQRAEIQRQYAAGLERGADASFLYTALRQLATVAAREPTRKAIADALVWFGMPTGGSGGPTLADSPYLTNVQHEDIRRTCRELFLLDAALLARDPGGQAEALALLDRAATLGESPYLLRLRAGCLKSMGKETEAADALKRAETVRRTGATDPFLTGLDVLQAGGPSAAKSARALMDEALLEQPNHYGAKYGRAICCLLERDYSEARTALTGCLEDRPNFHWPKLLRGFAHTQLSEFDRAATDFNEVLAWARGSGGDPLAAYIALTSRAQLRLKQRQPMDAVPDLREAVVLRPTTVQAYILLAKALEEAKDLQGAVVELNAAIEKVPTSAMLLATRADLHHKLKDDTSEKADHERAIAAAGPADRTYKAASHDGLGRLLHKAGEYGKAVAEFERALRADSTHVSVYRLKAQSLAALRQDDDAAEALQAYETEAKNTPGYDKFLPEVLEARGRLAARAHKYPDALECYTRSLLLRPDPRVRALRGWVYLINGSTKLAEPDFVAALGSDADDADALLGLAECRVKEGRLSEALRDANRALQVADGKAGEEVERMSYNACRIYAQAAAKSTERPANASAYTERALALLGKAMEAVPVGKRADFWRRTADKDATLSNLRRHPGWQSLVLRYADAGK